MKTINCTLKGITPLLQNKRPLPKMPIIKIGDKVIQQPPEVVKRKGELETVDLLEQCHHDDNGIYIPYNAIFMTIANGGKFVTGATARQNMTKTLLSGIVVNPEKIYLNPQVDPEAFERPLRRENGELITAVSAMFKDWSVSFEITVDDRVVKVEKLKQSVELAGTLVGLGCWAPRDKGGRFGRFELVEWK